MSRFLVLGVLVSGLMLVPVAMATNGMNLEGYGPVAGAMGGASLAFDNGTAATMNNPATLALAPDGLLVNLALGQLGPDVTAVVVTPQGEMRAESSAGAFYMPAIGVVKKKGRFAYGLGLFGQGGMGTEYANDSWLSDPSQGANMALTEGLVNRSEVSIGRAIAPITYDVNERFRIGGSLDFVWAGMDLQMAMSEAQFQDLTNPMSQVSGTASGSLVEAFGGLYEPFGTGISTLHHAYFDFSNDGDFTGEAMGYGFAAKLGMVYDVMPSLTVGAVYQSKTSLGDLETDNAQLSMGVNINPSVLNPQAPNEYTDMVLAVDGKITVKDFQWPALYGLGLAFHPNDDLLLALDVRYMAWSDVMDKFKMSFEADQSLTNGPFANLELDAVLFQEWDDQTVISVGGAYEAMDGLTLRAGYNKAANPVPDKFLNALFPAITEDHLTFGGGYKINEASSVDVSVMAVLENDGTNPGNGSTVPPVRSEHNQLNWMLMYSHRF
ncbi:OmpP1/FadL family transporter [Candidatus Eisenbacteria bacterium]|uniref:OmpP1/FadL family transporter n=1 Tax=Eiseniibacteriota bacterium TaxID=2212470 RepID=A0ABV6YJG2_UNCEI